MNELVKKREPIQLDEKQFGGKTIGCLKCSWMGNEVYKFCSDCRAVVLQTNVPTDDEITEAINER